MRGRPAKRHRGLPATENEQQEERPPPEGGRYRMVHPARSHSRVQLPRGVRDAEPRQPCGVERITESGTKRIMNEFYETWKQASMEKFPELARAVGKGIDFAFVAEPSDAPFFQAFHRPSQKSGEHQIIWDITKKTYDIWREGAPYKFDVDLKTAAMILRDDYLSLKTDFVLNRMTKREER